jgi:ribosomal protein S18 acetylase RimI-like enzyme
MDIIYRDGRKEDSLRLAELVNIASEGVVEYLFHDLIPDLTPVQIIAHNLESDKYPRSYKSTIVAESNGKIVGMALSIPSQFHRITEEMKNFFPEERLAHLKHFFATRIENSLLLDTLCVEEEFRGKGIGGELISLTEKKAKENSYDALSLIVFADNTAAQRLYKRCGFEIVEKVKLESHQLIPHEGGCFLMKYNITLKT